MGELEALWEEPESAGAASDVPLAGLVCHPHPLYGGTLHNKVVHHTALALQELGLPVDPAKRDDFSYLAGCGKPKLFVQGTRDQFGTRAAVEAVLAQAAAPKEIVWIEGADHFFAGHLNELRQAIRDHLPLRSS